MDIKAIEDAIVEALKDALGSACKTVDSYHGEIDNLIDKVGQLTVPLPAAFVLYGGSIFTEGANMSFDDTPTFKVVFIAKDLRSDRVNRRDGIYELRETALGALVNNDLGLDIRPLVPRKMEAIVVTSVVSCYGLDLETWYSMDT